MKTELGIFERQALIERLAQRFAALNGYKIEPDVRISNAKHPQLQMWVAMAQVAVEEIEKEVRLKSNQDIVQNFLARHEDETHTRQEWEDLAASEGLDEDDINELMEYLDDYH